MRHAPLGLLVLLASALPAHAQWGRTDGTRSDHVRARTGFEPNRGQLPDGARYGTRTGPGATLLTDDGATIALDRNDADGSRTVLGLRWVRAHAQPVHIPAEPRGTRLNFLHSSRPSEWITDVPTFSSVRQLDVWSGIDVRWHVGRGQLEYDFELEPGADVEDVCIEVQAADGLSIGPNGELYVETPLGRIVNTIPRIWQEADGESTELQGRFTLRGGNRVGFEVDRIDPSLPLVIDPIVDWGTYLPGTAPALARLGGVAIAEDGSVAYVARASGDYGWATTPGTYQPDPPTGSSSNISVGLLGKISADGESLLWATYFGDTTGFSSVQPFDLTFLGDGRIAVGAGARFDSLQYPFTADSGFPVPAGPGQGGVLTVFGPNGASVPYSAVIGGNGRGVDADPQGRLVVTGDTRSSFSTYATTGVYMPSIPGPNGEVAFATKIDVDLGERIYWTFLSNATGAASYKVAVDDQGRAFFIAKARRSSTTGLGPFATPNGYITSIPGFLTYWVGGLSDDGSDLFYGSYVDWNPGPFAVFPCTTFCGSPGPGSPLSSVATDGSGRIWFGWYAWPGFLPNTGPPMIAARDMVVTCLDTLQAGDDSVVWSRALGTSVAGMGGYARIHQDSVLVAGKVAGEFVPCAPTQGAADFIVASFDKNTGDLRHSWVIGGDRDEGTVNASHPFDVNSSGRAVVGGDTTSSFGVTTPGALNETRIAAQDPFVSTIFDVTRDPCGPSDLEPPVVTITAPPEDSVVGTTSIELTADVVDDSETAVDSSPAGVAPSSLPAGGGTVTGPVALPVEGGNLLTVNAVDTAGNEGGSSVTVYRDTIPPAVTVSPAEGSVLGLDSVELLITVEDRTETRVRVDGALAATLPVDGGGVYGTVSDSLTSAQSGLPEGASNFTVVAVDAAGNTTTVVRTIVVDSLAPVIVIQTPANGDAFAAAPVPLSANVTDDSPVDVTGVLAASLPAGGGEVTGPVALIEGWNDLGLVATDDLGNQASDSVSVLLDSTPPVVSITSPVDLSVVRGVVDYQALAQDPVPGTGVSSVDLLVDGAPLASFGTGPYESLLDTTLLSDGWHVLTAVGTDVLGNGAQDEIQVQVDNTAPTVVITDPPAGTLLTGDITFVAYAADDESGLVSLDMRSGGGEPSIVDGSVDYATPVADDVRTSIDVAPSSDGAWTLSASATDAAGNSAQAQIQVFTDNSAPDKAILSPADGARVSGIVPVQVSVDDANLDHVELFIGGQLVLTESAMNFDFAWDTTARADGPVQIALIATDTLGASSACSITVTVDNSSCVEIHPETLNLASKGKQKSITVRVCGFGLEDLLPTEQADLRLCIPGGSPVASTADFAGDDHVQGLDSAGFGTLLLKFDRQALIASIRAGIQGGAITDGRVVLTLKAGGDVLGSDEMRLVGE